MSDFPIRWPHLTLALFLAFTLSGCFERDDKVYNIVVIPKGLTHEHWQSVLRGAERAAEDLTSQGLPTRIIWDGPLRERDALAQIRIVDRRISTRVAGIVLAPQHSQTMVAPVQRAVDQHIPTVVIDSGLEAPLFVKYVATNNYNGGRLAGLHLLKLLQADGKKEPRIVMLRYQVGSESTDQREKGFEDVINQYIQENHLDPAKVWLSSDKYAGATKDSAQREAAPLVNRLRDQIDGIFCPNESSTMGMLQVLRNLGLAGKIRLMGFDSSEALQQAIRDGEVDGLILQDPYMMGYLSVWALVHHLAGYDVNAGGQEMVLGTGEHVITKANIDAPSTVELFDPQRQAQRNLKPPQYPKK